MILIENGNRRCNPIMIPHSHYRKQPGAAPKQKPRTHDELRGLSMGQKRKKPPEGGLFHATWRRGWDSPTCCRPRHREYAMPFESHPQGAQAPCSSVTSRNEKSHLAVAFSCSLAERVGFEPTVRSPVRLISSQVHSTTLPPLLNRCCVVA